MMCLNCHITMQPYFSKKSFKIVRCKVCRLMAVENVPEDLSPFYSKGYFTGDVTLDGYMDYDLDKEVTKKTYSDFLDTIAKFVPKKSGVTMLEIGCATGFFMKLAEAKGWKTEGIDISEYAISKAREKGLIAVTGTLDTYIADKKFDAVVMQDVIEHVKDPVDTIKKTAELMESGGVLALTTPDAGSLWAKAWGKHWHAFVPPQHLFYFTAKNITTMLEAEGFRVVHVDHHGKWFAIPYIVRLFYSWTGLRFFSTLAGWLSKSFLKGVAIPLNVRDTLYIIATKKN